MRAQVNFLGCIMEGLCNGRNSVCMNIPMAASVEDWYKIIRCAILCLSGIQMIPIAGCGGQMWIPQRMKKWVANLITSNSIYGLIFMITHTPIDMLTNVWNLTVYTHIYHIPLVLLWGKQLKGYQLHHNSLSLLPK